MKELEEFKNDISKAINKFAFYIKLALVINLIIQIIAAYLIEKYL